MTHPAWSLSPRSDPHAAARFCLPLGCEHAAHDRNTLAVPSVLKDHAPAKGPSRSHVMIPQDDMLLALGP